MPSELRERQRAHLVADLEAHQVGGVTSKPTR